MDWLQGSISNKKEREGGREELGKERKGREGEERKGKEEKGKERKGKERRERGLGTSIPTPSTHILSYSQMLLLLQLENRGFSWFFLPCVPAA